MTIAVVTVAYGAPYRKFLTGWGQAINALTTKPNEVVVATDCPVEAIDRLAELSVPHTTIRVQGQHKNHPQWYVNQAIAVTSTDYVIKMDADDRFFPHALDNVEEHGADVVALGIQVGDVQLPSRPVTAHNILTCSENLVFSGSAFRRWVWEAAPFRDMIYEDWAFWIEAAKNNATFAATGRVDYEYRQHNNNITRNVIDGYWRSIVNGLR